MLRSNTCLTVESRVLLVHEYAHLGLDSGRFDAIHEPEASCTLTPWPPWRSADTVFLPKIGPKSKLSLSFTSTGDRYRYRRREFFSVHDIPRELATNLAAACCLSTFSGCHPKLLLNETANRAEKMLSRGSIAESTKFRLCVHERVSIVMFVCGGQKAVIPGNDFNL